MTKYERIIRLPAVVLSRRAAEQIAERMHKLAEQRITVELEGRLRALYRGSQDPLNLFARTGPIAAAIGEDQFVQQNLTNDAYRDMLRPQYGDKYTFLSPHGNVQFLYEDFDYDDIPKDVDLVLAEAAGPKGELLALSAKARSQVLDLADPNQNRILIQGPDRAWVSDTYDRLREQVGSSREPVRHIVYHGIPFFVWLTFFVSVFLEYRLFNRLAGFNWATPLNGLQILFVFILLAVTLIGSSLGFQRLFPLLFPYFEFEDNLARWRKTLRRPVIVAFAALYSAGILLLFGLR